MNAILYWISIYFFGINFLKSIKSIVYFSKTDTNESYSPEMIDMYKYISKNVQKDEIIAFLKIRALRLFTDRNTIYVDQNNFPDSNAQFLLIKKDEYSGILI